MARPEDVDSAENGRERTDDDVPVESDQPPPLRQVVARVRDGFAEITGLEAERITELRPAGDGWRVRIDVVELSRVPTSTDVLATYEVTAHGDGSVASFERVRRFRRSEARDR